MSFYLTEHREAKIPFKLYHANQHVMPTKCDGFSFTYRHLGLSVLNVLPNTKRCHDEVSFPHSNSVPYTTGPSERARGKSTKRL